MTVIFGMGVVWLLLCMKKWLGGFGALAAAALAAVSAGFVFFSRYFIHEILFVFFTLGVLVALLKLSETRRPRYAVLAAASLSLLGATKETWIITGGVWVIALPCTWLWMKLRGRDSNRFWSIENDTAGHKAGGGGRGVMEHGAPGMGDRGRVCRYLGHLLFVIFHQLSPGRD